MFRVMPLIVALAFPLPAYAWPGTVALVATDRVLNADMLEAGQVWAYPQYCKASFCKGWKKLEQDAKEARRGLWSRKNPTPPWKWRKR